MMINNIESPCARGCRWVYPNNDGGLWCNRRCKNPRFPRQKDENIDLIGKLIKIAENENQSLEEV